MQTERRTTAVTLRYDQLTVLQAAQVARDWPGLSDPWRYEYIVSDTGYVISYVARG